MKIYVNERYEICELHETNRADLTEIEADEEQVGNWCEAALYGFRYEPSFAVDGEGEYILNEHGEKIQAGWAFYPFIDFNIIQSIQNLYDKEVQALKTSNEDLTLAMADILGGAL